MRTIETRVEELENRICTDDENKVDGVFYVPEDASLDAKPPVPVQCWSFNGYRITRQAGETDEAFRQRAIDEVKPSLGKMVVPVFMGE
jgi:hypothetical protein